MLGNYFCIDSILAEEERIPSEFTISVVNLGYLDPCCTEEDLPKGTLLELPFWLAQTLHSKRHRSPEGEKPFVRIGLPKFFNQLSRENLRAGPSATNLRDKTPYFYELGRSLSFLTNDAELLTILRQALSGPRFVDISNKSLNSRTIDMTEFTRNLTEAER